jgi:hypothetical protein
MRAWRLLWHENSVSTLRLEARVSNPCSEGRLIASTASESLLNLVGDLVLGYAAFDSLASLTI